MSDSSDDRDDADGVVSDSGGEDAGPPQEESIGLLEARELAVQGAKSVLEHELDNVVRVERTDEGWQALVEVLERSAVPDTQDILGRYEVELDATGTLTGYGLVERYRRGDSREEL